MEPVEGIVYKFSFVTGRYGDHEMNTTTGTFMKKIEDKGEDIYIFSTKVDWMDNPFHYFRYSKQDKILAKEGPTTDTDYPLLRKVLESPEYIHPDLDFKRNTPYYLLNKADLERLSDRQKARENIAGFMTTAIHSPPIYNKNNNTKVLFSGGPMYKRGLKSFHNARKSRRSARKSRRSARKSRHSARK